MLFIYSKYTDSSLNGAKFVELMFFFSNFFTFQQQSGNNFTGAPFF